MVSGFYAGLFEGNVGDCNGCSQGANRGTITMIRPKGDSGVQVTVSLQNGVPNVTYNLNWKCVQGNIGTLTTDATGSGAAAIIFNGGATKAFAIDMQAKNASGQQVDNIGSGGLVI